MKKTSFPTTKSNSGKGKLLKAKMSSITAAPAKVDYFSATGALLDHYNHLIHKVRHKIFYSDKYSDDLCEYRHVKLPLDLKDMVPLTRLMREAEWRMLGVTMSPGWEQYMIHSPEPHILLFRRPLPTQQNQQPAR